MAFLDFIKNRDSAPQPQPAQQSQPRPEAAPQRSVENLPANVKAQAVDSARPAAELMDKATTPRTGDAQPSMRNTPDNAPARGRGLSMER